MSLGAPVSFDSRTDDSAPLALSSGSPLRLAPISLKEAAHFNTRHRHNKTTGINRFAIGLKCGEQLVGVAIVGNPKAGALDTGENCEVTRLCTDGTLNACSMLYGAAARAAKAMGFGKIYTYTLASEPGTSLRAAGFVKDADVRGEKSWDRPSRPRTQTNMFGEESRPTEDKIRWVRVLANIGHEPRAK